MELFVIVFFLVAMVLVGVGIAIGLVGCLATAVLLALGVISSSFFVGWRAGRPSAGIRAFLLQCGILAGIPAGAVCAWLAHNFVAAYGNDMPILLYGALGGAVAGAVIALGLDFMSRQTQRWLSSRALPARSAEQPAIGESR
jgi:hypothetical protein